MNSLWAYIPATFLGGLVFGAGLFFYKRAKLIEQYAQQGAPADVPASASLRPGRG